jgi:hypothetical protein
MQPVELLLASLLARLDAGIVISRDQAPFNDEGLEKGLASHIRINHELIAFLYRDMNRVTRNGFGFATESYHVGKKYR